MVENTGNSYRTRQAVVAAFVLIALALAIIVYGATDAGASGAVGVFLLITGIGITVLSFLFSNEPDKFGPSELMYRLVAGLLILIVGLAVLLYALDVEGYVIAAVVIIAIALIGLCTALINGKNTKY